MDGPHACGRSAGFQPAVFLGEAPRAETPSPGSSNAEAAARVGLSSVDEDDPGFRRRRRGKGFGSLHTDGSPVRDAETLRRIGKLAIPPAYEDIWICHDPMGHIQATGRDAKGREQYKYHGLWRAAWG